MSKVVHRKPVRGWSVALLSTLLLTSPLAATALMHALAHASTTVSLPSEAAVTQTARRAGDENALRAARGGQPLTLRLDTQPETVAILYSSRAVLLVPDDAPPAPVRAPFPDAPVSHALATTPPRAPPA